MDKFMGRPKSQKAAATGVEIGGSDEEPFEECEEEEVEPAEIKATNSTTLAQLLEQQKALAAQIATLREEDF
jgi:hypothetical protein